MARIMPGLKKSLPMFCWLNTLTRSLAGRALLIAASIAVLDVSVMRYNADAHVSQS